MDEVLWHVFRDVRFTTDVTSGFVAWLGFGRLYKAVNSSVSITKNLVRGARDDDRDLQWITQRNLAERGQICQLCCLLLTSTKHMTCSPCSESHCAYLTMSANLPLW